MQTYNRQRRGHIKSIRVVLIVWHDGLLIVESHSRPFILEPFPEIIPREVVSRE